MDARSGPDTEAAASPAVSKAESHRIPLIDFHCHGGDISRTDEIEAYIRSEGLSALALLSLPLAGLPGYSGKAPHLNEAVLETKRRLSDRFPGDSEAAADAAAHRISIRTFGCLDNRPLIGAVDGPDSAAQVAELQAAGFDGLKIWEGKPELAAALDLMPDSPWLVDACREAGRRGMPVIFHIADPPEFWSSGAGEASLADRRVRGRAVPGFDAVVEASLRLCREAPDTSIIFPHLGFLAGDLERAGRFLTEAPNAFFDLAPGNYFYAELARTPQAARDFFSRWKNRILFGSDSFFLPTAAGGDRIAESRPTAEGMPFAGDSLEGNRRRLQRLKSFLESSPDESVDNVYPLTKDRTPRISCLGLAEEILEPIFHRNAASLF